MLTRNAVMIVPAFLCAFRLWADTVEVSNDTEIESLPADVATLEYTGAGLLTITGARPIDSTTTTSVTFNCPVRFTAEEATLVLRNGQINFAKPVSFVQLRSEAKKISIQGTATVSGTKLDIIGLDTLNSDITTTSLVVENGTDELPNRFAGLGELRTKGPAKVRFTGAGSSAANTTDRIAKWAFGQWNTQIALEANMTLTIGTASAEPGGFMSRSVASGCFLKSEEPMANGIWKPFTALSNEGKFSGVDAGGNVVDSTPTVWLASSGNNAGTAYRQSNSTLTLSDDAEISAYRAGGWVNIDLNGHDLVVGSGIFATGTSYKDVKVYDTAGGGRLVFGSQDIFMNFSNNKPVISAPLAWRRPAGNVSVGPSLFIQGNHWASFQFLGDDQINDYNIVSVGNDDNQETVFGGSGDRTIHGALVGTSPLRKEGTGTLRIAGAHYPLNSNTINVNAGRVVFDKNESRYYTVNVKSNATLEVGAQFDTAIGGLDLKQGATLAGSGKISTTIRNLESGRWLSPGSSAALGTLKITAEGNDAQFYFKSGAGFKIKLSESESDCVNLCAGWHYLTMPGAGGTFNLELSPLADGFEFSPSQEYKIFFRSGSDSNGDRFYNKTGFTWNITTTHPKQLDVRQAKVEYKDNAYWLSGVKTPHPGLSIFVR